MLNAPPDVSLRIDELTLKNYRCFAKCELKLHPRLTVLVAENAQGKTAVLNGVGAALDVFVSAALGRNNANNIDPSSVHLIRNVDSRMVPALPTEIHAAGYINSKDIKWSRIIKSNSATTRTLPKDAKSAVDATIALVNDVLNESSEQSQIPALLPIVAFYKTDRLWGDRINVSSRRKPKPIKNVRLSAYVDWASPSSSFNSFTNWYGDAVYALRSPTSKLLMPDERFEKQLAAIREAVKIVLEPTGWTSIDWEFPSESGYMAGPGVGFIVVEHFERGRYPLSLLSDGLKNMISLVADLAYRCVRLNPHLGEDAAKLTPGIVLIDEVDIHLHPSWQQVVVGLLQKAFPAIQIIITTHSPQVLSTVDSDSIRLIRLENSNAIVKKPDYQTRGIESADILAKLMNVDPVPHVEEAHWLSTYRSMIQTDDFETEEGQALWTKLVNHFGEEHPILTEMEPLRSLQKFKRANRIS